MTAVRHPPAKRPLAAATAMLGLALAALSTLAFGPCGTGAPAKPTPQSTPLADGVTLPPSDVRSLLSVTCRGDRLIVRTTKEGIVADSDCSRQPPQATLDRFLGQPVTVSFAAGTLRFQNVNAGALDLPASNPQLTPSVVQ